MSPTKTSDPFRGIYIYFYHIFWHFIRLILRHSIWHSIWHTSSYHHISDILLWYSLLPIYILTFDVAFWFGILSGILYMTFVLAVDLAFYLTFFWHSGILSFYVTFLLTLYLTFFPAFYLASILTFFLVFYVTFVLKFFLALSDILSVIYTFFDNLCGSST